MTLGTYITLMRLASKTKGLFYPDIDSRKDCRRLGLRRSRRAIKASKLRIICQYLKWKS